MIPRTEWPAALAEMAVLLLIIAVPLLLLFAYAPSPVK